MRFLGYFIYTALFFSLFSCNSIQMDTSIKNRERKVTDYIERLTESELTGIQYLVINKEKTLINYAGGLSDVASQKLMRSETLMQTASMSKTLTAIAILQLAENGKLKLDDSVSTYFNDHPYGEQITIRQLITHTAGVPNPIPTRWFHTRESHPNYDKDKVLRAVLKENAKLDSNPGEKYNYSNIGYWLLGRIIENASGERFQDFIRKHILEPLDMEKESVYEMAPHLRTAKGYLAKYSFFNLIKGWITEDYMWSEYEENWLTANDLYQDGEGLGGLITNATSISLFLKDQLQESSRIINEETKTLLYQPQSNSKGTEIPMTLGWHVGDTDGVKYFFKEGMGAGFHCEMRVYPKQKIASVVLVNKMFFKTKRNLDIMDREFY